MTNKEAQLALANLKRYISGGGAVDRGTNRAIDIAIEALGKPEPHWIPVTEPPKSDFMPYYATCRSKVDDRENWVIEGMYTKYSGWEYPPMVRDNRAEIIAWMPKELPEPFKEVTDGNQNT